VTLFKHHPYLKVFSLNLKSASFVWIHAGLQHGLLEDFHLVLLLEIDLRPGPSLRIQRALVCL